MKELSIEEKAKVYDSALEAIKECIPDENGFITIYPQEIFPELAESKDDRMIKSINRLIRYYHDVNFPTPEGFSRKDLLDWIEKQGEQKPVDKVEPKFKVDDWVVSPNGVYWHIDAIDNNRYEISSSDGAHADWSLNTNLYHLWTIQDAKNGDVLACDDEDKVFIYNGKLDLKDRVCAYCGIYKAYDELRFTECSIGNSFTYKEPHPATKEQRDLLFQKMKEAGYEWNSDKKELKKIEQKPANWLQELENKLANATPKQLAEWKEKYFKEEPAEWSEEDEKKLNNAIIQLQAASHIIFEDEVNDSIAFIKSLKDRVQPKPTWRPSDRQMNVLEHYMHTLSCNEHKEILFGLYTDLKKLREE